MSSCFFSSREKMRTSRTPVDRNRSSTALPNVPVPLLVNVHGYLPLRFGIEAFLGLGLGALGLAACGLALVSRRAVTAPRSGGRLA